MVFIYHQYNKVVAVEHQGKTIQFPNGSVTDVLFDMAASYPTGFLIWCHSDLKSNLNTKDFDTIFHHDKIMASYSTSNTNYLPEAIGYVEESPFIKINKAVTYPTWRMSSDIGGINAQVLLQLEGKIALERDFNYFLNSVAKVGMPKGLFCYSEPKLLIENEFVLCAKRATTFELFKFVKQHYRTRWIFLLFLNLLIYEKRFPFLSLINSLFYTNRNNSAITFDAIQVKSTKKVVEFGTVDVIIPTIGRKQYLYDVLKDLAHQTHLPLNVIIVEQNPQENSVSELDYLHAEKWPFVIKHTFTHQAGACNARNIALSQVESEWVFMADDDIRIESDFIKKAILSINIFGINTVTFGCYEEKYLQNKKNKQQQQWSSFGSGCSIVKNNFTENSRYRKGFEFGYGEDSDYGMQLRNSGADVLYFPNPEILHLKAPIGGFRTKPILDWANDVIQPKPSPTVMLFKQLHLTKEQINGYRTILFFKFYSVQKIKNPIRYFINFKKQWSQSLFWSNQLMNKE